jgi:ankyrin repeat protein
MAPFDRMPNELIAITARQLSSEKDISAFMRCSCRLHSLLYRSLCKYNIQHNNGLALHFAAGNGHLRFVKLMFDLGANIGSLDASFVNTTENHISRRDNLLLEAAVQGHLKIVHTLLSEARPGQECAKEQLVPVLHWAIQNQDSKLFDALLAKNVPLHYINSGHGTDALGCAIVFGADTAIIERLLHAGAGIQEPDFWLGCLAANEREGQICTLLLEFGRRPRSDLVLLCLAVDNNIQALDMVTNVDTNGLDIRLYGHMALSVAVAHGHLEMVKQLIKKGANPHVRRSLGLPLHHGYSTVWVAVAERRFEVLEFLLKQQGVRLDKRDLERATEDGLTKAVDLLETFSLNDAPEKMDVSLYIAMMEDEHGKPDSDFHATSYWGLDDGFSIYFDPGLDLLVYSGWDLYDNCE